MSGHSLPDDLTLWPVDPFALLGVGLGASPRDLKRAYHALIRKYKPEHAPEAFRRIRAAYESAQRFGEFLGAPTDHAGAGDGAAEESTPGTAPDPDPETRLLPRGPRAPLPDDALTPPRMERAAPPDLWEAACRGDEASAYRGLRERLDRGPGSEEVFVQLYWLLVAAPGLDPGRQPADWLVRGLRTCDQPARRLRELLRRESAADPLGAVGQRLAGLFAPGTPSDIVLDAADCRWRAARILERWRVITDDVLSLRGGQCKSDPEVWARLLLTAAGNAVWAIGFARYTARTYRQEAEQLAHDHALDVADDLTRLEYAESVMNGLSSLDLRGAGDGGLRRLLAVSWDDRGSSLRHRLLPYLRGLAREPWGALGRLDLLRVDAPAALGMLRELIDPPANGALGPRTAEEAETFLAASRWWNYPMFRRELLTFSLREMIAPDAVAGSIEGRPDFVLTGGSHLAHTVASDWPLLLVYRACEVAWE